MKERTTRSFQALIMAGLGAFLLFQVVNGGITFYIHQRFVWLVVVGAILLLVIAQTLFQSRSQINEDDPHEHSDGEDDDHHHVLTPGWVLWLMILPVMMGVLLPQRALSASVIQNRGIQTGGTLSSNTQVIQVQDIPPEQRTVLDWVRLFSQSDTRAQIKGQPVDVIGFVYRDPRLPAGQFMVARFTLTCCVADASALALIVSWEDADSLVENRWVRVRGVLDETLLDGHPAPLVLAKQVEEVPEPSQPYLYP
ncbi:MULTISPECIES: TIGR03943 family putative permease subunit [Anaerolinea]|uniref:TIGR03943 family putative permease subunit n=1 Tax=Anaerolinea TaxID=233189 RepID=UPI0026372D21|nr:TIGR03943 family protein [Anaerolinea thermophila]